MSKQVTHYFDQKLDGSERVDFDSGVISGVSVITSGVSARGHNLEVDSKTLDQIKTCALSMKTVPVKVDHKSGAGEVCGYLNNFHLEDGKLKADWNLLKNHPRYGHIMEMAHRMPSNVGLSAAFMGKEEIEQVFGQVQWVMWESNEEQYWSKKQCAAASQMILKARRACLHDLKLKTQMKELEIKHLNKQNLPPIGDDMHDAWMYFARQALEWLNLVKAPAISVQGVRM
jgi:hypothetical protein